MQSDTESSPRVWTHPYAVLMPVLFPRSARVTVEQQVTADPVPAVITSLCGHSGHLHLLPEVHLEPGLLVGHHRRPAACTWGGATNYRQTGLHIDSVDERPIVVVYSQSRLGSDWKAYKFLMCTQGVLVPNILWGDVTPQQPQWRLSSCKNSWFILRRLQASSPQHKFGFFLENLYCSHYVKYTC